MKALSALTFLFLAVMVHEGMAQAFTPVNLAALTNYKRGHVTAVPIGRVTFNGVPFDMPSPPRAIMTEGPFVPTTTLVGISVNVAQPTSVHILLSGAYVKLQFKDKKIGAVKLRFADGSEQTNPIIAGQTIRETWAYDGEAQEPKATGNPRLVNVHSEPQIRGGRQATAFLDMLVIDLGETKLGTCLAGITIEDTSRETIGNMAPSLVISAITIGHAAGQRPNASPSLGSSKPSTSKASPTTGSEQFAYATMERVEQRIEGTTKQMQDAKARYPNFNNQYIQGTNYFIPPELLLHEEELKVYRKMKSLLENGMPPQEALDYNNSQQAIGKYRLLEAQRLLKSAWDEHSRVLESNK